MTDSACVDSQAFSKWKVVARAIIIVGFLALVFLPEVVSVSWHLFHGNFARFHEWEVPVPLGWRAFTGEDTLVVQRLHRFYFRRGAFSEVVVAPLILPPNHTFEYENWKNAIIQTQLKYGYQFTNERTIHLEGHEGYCFVFRVNQNAQRLWITCDVPELHLSVGFIGDQTHASALDSTIQRIRRAD
jgi:hypothetical protein